MTAYQDAPGSDPTLTAARFRRTAVRLFTRVLAFFAVPGTPLLREQLQPAGRTEQVGGAGEEIQVAYVWPFSAALAAANALAAHPGQEGAVWRPVVERLVGEALPRYWDDSGPVPGYDSAVLERGGGQRYYDDNAWIGLELLRAARILGRPELVDQAERTFAFVISGWDDRLGGGIAWREGDPGSKNTCSNGPAALLAAELYLFTGDHVYLKWSERIYNWLVQTLQAPSGRFWDAIRQDGSIDRTFWTYNTGTPLETVVLLYRLFQDVTYLDAARWMVEGSRLFFDPIPSDSVVESDPISYPPPTPWFNAVLLRGYLRFAEVTGNSEPLRWFERSVRAALVQARDADGWFLPDWRGGLPRRGQAYLTLLDQAAMVEILARLAAWLEEGPASSLKVDD
ncbi:MAG: hypothetical protein IMX00_01745 [Limnochordales bacterium]|nr:hypothetical protein [Limnochordales bacterium]